MQADNPSPTPTPMPAPAPEVLASTVGPPLAEVLAAVTRAKAASPSLALRYQRLYDTLIGVYRLFRVMLFGGPKQGKGWLLSACAPVGRSRWLSFDKAPDIEHAGATDMTLVPSPSIFEGSEPYSEAFQIYEEFFRTTRAWIQAEGQVSKDGISVPPLQLVAADTLSTLRQWVMDCEYMRGIKAKQPVSAMEAGATAASHVRSICNDIVGLSSAYVTRGQALARDGRCPLDAPIVLGVTCHAQSVTEGEVSPQKTAQGRAKMDNTHLFSGPALGGSQEKMIATFDVIWGVGIGSDGRGRSRHRVADFAITPRGVPSCEARFASEEWALVLPILAEKVNGRPDPTRMYRAFAAVWGLRKTRILQAIHAQR